MKTLQRIQNWVILGSIVAFFHTNAFGCDLCGCASAGAQLGVLPQYNRSFAGFRFQYNSFRHLNVLESQVVDGRVLRDETFSTEAWTRLMLSPNDQLMISVPYIIKKRRATNSTTDISGIGDISLLYNRIILQKDLMPWSYQWTAGGGLRLPTAKYRQRNEDRVMLPIGMQVGTGAWAFPLYSQFGLRYNDWGILSEAFIQIHSENENAYKIGNYYQGSLYLAHYAVLKKSMWMPHLGLRYEQTQGDLEFNKNVDHTGGQRWAGLLGLDAYFGEWSLGLRYQQALSQDLIGVQPEWDGLFSIHLVRFWGS